MLYCKCSHIRQPVTHGGIPERGCRPLTYMPPIQSSSTGVIRDQNHVPIWWGVSSVDGYTLVPIERDSATGRMKMEIGTSTMAVMSSLQVFFERDANAIPCIGGQSSVDATKVIPISVNPANGAVQAQTT